MKLLLMFTVLGTVLVATGLLGLWIQTTLRIREIENELKANSKDIKKNRRKISILEERDAQKSDKIVISHEWNEAAGIRYPSQEV